MRRDGLFTNTTKSIPFRHVRFLHNQDGAAEFLPVVQEAADHPVTITNHGKAVAVMMSIERMETMEVLADPKAMAAIRKHREGRAAYHDLSALESL